jgi:GWxTD domain-containing protein
VVVFDNDGEQADGKIWQDQVNVSGYEQTNSRGDFSIAHAGFDLPPGDYNLSIGVMDLDTRKTNRRETAVQLRDFSTRPLSISDITYVGDLEIDSLGISSIRPEVSDNTVGVGRNLFAYFEIYSNLPDDPVRVTYRVLDSKNNEALSGSYLRRPIGFRTLDYFRVATDSLFFGKYVMHLKVEATNHSDETQKMFNVRWIGLPTSAADLELAVDQVKYIASKEEHGKLREGTQQDRLREFQRFWKRRDPTPGTETNEAMDEHYRRVQYANETFTVFRDGWKTDMGMVYIILGSPNDIERNPYPAGDKPYEIWYYYKINRQFLFYDYTGFGDYRLANPYSFYDLNRLR